MDWQGGVLQFFFTTQEESESGGMSDLVSWLFGSREVIIGSFCLL